MEEQNLPNVYEVKLRLLGNEVIAISIGSSSISNKWIALGLGSMFSLLLLFGIYGDNFVNLFGSLSGR